MVGIPLLAEVLLPRGDCFEIQIGLDIRVQRVGGGRVRRPTGAQPVDDVVIIQQPVREVGQRVGGCSSLPLPGALDAPLAARATRGRGSSVCKYLVGSSCTATGVAYDRCGSGAGDSSGACHGCREWACWCRPYLVHLVAVLTTGPLEASVKPQRTAYNMHTDAQAASCRGRPGALSTTADDVGLHDRMCYPPGAPGPERKLLSLGRGDCQRGGAT